MASIVKILRAAAEPNRLRILLLLKAEELSVAELQEILTMGQSTISTHLSQLKHAGLVEDRRTGKSNLYRLSGEAGSPAGEFLNGLLVLLVCFLVLRMGLIQLLHFLIQLLDHCFQRIEVVIAHGCLRAQRLSDSDHKGSCEHSKNQGTGFHGVNS